MTPAEKFIAEFEKFKESKPEFKSGFTALKLREWHSEYITKTLHEEWRRGMLEAKKIIEDAPDTDDPRIDFMGAIEDAIEESAAPN